MTGANYEMYTPAGNRAVEKLVGTLRVMIEHGADCTAVGSKLDLDLVALARQHPEVRDTAVMDAIHAELSHATNRAGYVDAVFDYIVSW